MELQKSGSKRWFLIFCCILTAGALALGMYDFTLFRSKRESTAAQQASFGLKAERVGNDLKLTWNPRVEPLKTASQANLQIDDGQYHKDLVLRANQIRGGGIIYSPLTDNIVFHLKAVDKNHRASSETLQIVQPTGQVAESAWPPPELPVADGSKGLGQAPNNAAHRRTERQRTQARHLSEPLEPSGSAQDAAGSVIVRGTILRDTPVSVRIPVNSEGRPLREEPETTARTGLFHRISSLGKKTAHLWPFRNKEEHP